MLTNDDAALPNIASPMPVYEAMLQLATAQERQMILAGGPRERLDNNRLFGPPPEHEAALMAFKAMKAILMRITSGTDLCVTGIDPRMMPPHREVLDPALVRYGILIWEGPDGCISKLLLAFMHPVVHVADLRIEPTGQAAVVTQAAISRSTRLVGGERINDTSRLLLMQRFIDEGDTPKAAARKAAVAVPYPHSTEQATVTRLCRKFHTRAK
jgi:hypothetical protein